MFAPPTKKGGRSFRPAPRVPRRRPGSRLGPGLRRDTRLFDPLHLLEFQLDRGKRRGEPWETYTERLRAMWVSEKAREAEDAALRAALRAETDADWDVPGEEEDLPALPALDQVKGWSKADPVKAPHHPGLALFGGWRLSDWKKREGKR